MAIKCAAHLHVRLSTKCMETGNLITKTPAVDRMATCRPRGCPQRPPSCSVARRGGREERRGGQWSFGTSGSDVEPLPQGASVSCVRLPSAPRSCIARCTFLPLRAAMLLGRWSARRSAFTARRNLAACPRTGPRKVRGLVGSWGSGALTLRCVGQDRCRVTLGGGIGGCGRHHDVTGLFASPPPCLCVANLVLVA